MKFKPAGPWRCPHCTVTYPADYRAEHEPMCRALQEWLEAEVETLIVEIRAQERGTR